MRIKSIALLLVLLLIMSLAPQAIAVEKPYKIDSSTTWTGTISAPDLGFFLDKDVTLTIAPGTKVQMQKNMSVKNSIVAIGTPDEPIIFTSINPTPNPVIGAFLSSQKTAESVFSQMLFLNMVVLAQVEYSGFQVETELMIG
ncbi:MAG: hypothetical protein R2883_03670 [Caldisericia bacterium]